MNEGKLSKNRKDDAKNEQKKRGINLSAPMEKIKVLPPKKQTLLGGKKLLNQRLILLLLTPLIVLGGEFLCNARPARAQIPSRLQEPVVPATPEQETQPPVDYEETPYTLGAGDGVNINIFNVPEYSGQYRVSIEGTLNLPIVGSVQVRGLTIPQTTELITQRYTEILQRPIVSVTLTQPRPIRIAIAGEVNRPGSYNLGAGGGQFPPITTAIQQAGGVTRSANVRQVKLRRVIQGEPFILNVNLWELVQEGEIVQDVTLRDGDRIFIPTVVENQAEETRLIGQSAIAPVSQPIEVSVVGEVGRPGPHQVGGGSPGAPPTVTQAIQTAGGITNFSDIRDVRVERSTRAGTREVLSANLWDLLREGDVSQDVVLQPGDTVVVPRAKEINPTEAEALATASFSPETIRVAVLGEANRTGTLQLPSNTPLNQAILAAGDFRRGRADESEVELVRLNPNGTVTRREIEYDPNQGIDPESNPILRNGDVIVVGRNTLAEVNDTVTEILSPITSIVQSFRFFDIFFGNNN